MSEDNNDVELTPAVGPMVYTVPIPVELIVTSGVGHEVTNWHERLLPSDTQQHTERDVAEQQNRPGQDSPEV